MPLPQLPPRYDVLGLRVSRAGPAEVRDLILDAARGGRTLLVAHAPVHLVVEAGRDADLGARLDDFDVVTADGQPVRWALRWLHGVALSERVYGPSTMLAVCERAAGGGIGIYLYGSTPAVLRRLVLELGRRFPDLVIAGTHAPPFRPLSAEEDAAAVRRIRQSGAGVVFVGLGCPKQERFAHAHRGTIAAPLVCVGAAFDFLAGTKPMAPRWMQRAGLEWAFRLLSEPGRLWRRYLFTNSWFVLHVLRQAATRARPRTGEAPT